MRWCLVLTLLLICARGSFAAADAACSTDKWGPSLCIRDSHFVQDTCKALYVFAERHALDPHFFTRLIWQESRFDPNALSPVGAQGIAQFMPHTARRRGLADSYNPADALEHSAEYLAEMQKKYGSVGLAAVGYNGGERRAEGLIAGTGGLAEETVNYVRIITGVPHRNWLEAPEPAPDLRLSPKLSFAAACADLAQNRRMTALKTVPPAIRPWGIQLAFGTTQKKAKRAFAEKTRRCAALVKGQKVDYIWQKSRASAEGGYVMARLGRDTKAEAWRDCRALKAAGCRCIVHAND